MTDTTIPQQRTPVVKRVKTTYVVSLTLDESIARHKWRGATEDAILASFDKEEFDERIQELKDELDAIPEDDSRLLFVRTVKIVDPT